jgi:hypothetical protein
MVDVGKALVSSDDNGGVDELQRDEGSPGEWSASSISSRRDAEEWPKLMRAPASSGCGHAW